MSSERESVDHLLRVAASPRLSLLEVITLGLLVSRKWDRARAADLTGGQNVTGWQAAAFDEFTSAELNEFRAQAVRVLVEHAATIPRDGEGWFRGFWQGFASAWAYALSIAVVAFIVKLAGSDLLTILKDLFAKG